jgi:hypothetical protein
MAINGQPTDIGAQLEEVRMSYDWTYSELADRIAKVTSRRRADDCWRRICRGETPKPHERTLNIAERFLASVRRTRARRRSVASRRSVA